MAFGDFLTGATVSTAEQVGKQRDQRREDEQRSTAHKQDLGKMVLEGLVNGTVRPEFGSHVLGELDKLAQPRQPARGLEGFLGATQQPDTPNLDTLTSGGWGQAFISPAEKATQDFQRKLEQDAQGETASFRTKQRLLPEFIRTLQASMPNLSTEMATAAAIKTLYGADVLGVSGSASDYWDPVAKRPFRGQRGAGGIVDVTTGLPVQNARAVKLSTQDSWQTGEQVTIDDYTGEVLARTPKVVPGARPQQPFFMPSMGLAFGGPNGPYSATALPGAVVPEQPWEDNPDWTKWTAHKKLIDDAVDQEWRTLKELPAYKVDQQAALQALAAAKDKHAQAYGYPNYHDIESKLATAMPKMRRPQVDVGAGRSRGAAPGVATPPSSNERKDSTGAAYTIVPSKPGGGN